MIRALWTAATGMRAQQMNIDVIANNLANVNTPGFKRSNLQFEDMVYQTEKAPGTKLADGSAKAVGLQVGYGSRPTATARSFSEGELINTGNKTDLAIQGRGFFRLEMTDGTFAYTRDGSFKMNAEGRLVTTEGYKLAGVDQIDPKATDINIGADGTVSVIVNGATQQLSPVTLADFPNPDGLRSMGNNVLTETDASGPAQTGITPGQNGSGTLAQGFTESSNVQVVEEMVKLIQAQRAYEINSKAIQSSDEMMNIANNLRR